MKRGSATPLGQARASDFEIAISRFESSRPSQAVVQLEIVAPKIPEMPANGAFLQVDARSLHSQFEQSKSEITDSLWRIIEIFPFLGDTDRRPGSICAAWRTQYIQQCYGTNSASCRTSSNDFIPMLVLLKLTPTRAPWTHSLLQRRNTGLPKLVSKEFG